MIKKYTVDDFTIVTVLGKGVYGKIFLVRELETEQIYALKVLKKAIVERKHKSHEVFSERNILAELHHPFIIHMIGSFHNQRKLYFILEYCPGGELYSLLSRKDTFSEDQAKFYAAQALLALEYMHEHGAMHRDLKPENVLIDKDGYIRITHFNLAKKSSDSFHEKFSIVGTPEYLAPEVLLSEETGFPMDFWCLGALIHEMLTGIPPFYCDNETDMFEGIKSKPFHMEKKVSESCRSLLQGLFIKDPSARLGTKSILEIKTHPWFASVNWEALLKKQYKAPFVPVMKSSADFSYYESKFTELPVESFAESFAVPSTAVGNSLFSGFTYNAPIEERAETEEREEAPTLQS